MGEWHNFRSIFRGNFYDRVVLLTVFLLTVIFDLVIAIEVGMVLSAFLFIKRMSDITQVQMFDNQQDDEKLIQKLPPGVMVYEITGALFFGAAQTFQEALRQTNQKPKAVILNLKNVPLIDATGLYRLEHVVRNFKMQGTIVYLAGASASVNADLMQSNVGAMTISHPDLAYCIENAGAQFREVPS
jgi:SulP family sulfate permease